MRRESRMAGHRSLACAVWLICTAALTPARAVDVWSASGGHRYLTLDTALRWTTLLSRAPVDSLLYPERWSSTGSWRLRLGVRARPTGWLHLDLAYDHSARTTTENAGAAARSSVLPPEASAPYRVEPLEATLLEVGATYQQRHGLDRACLTFDWGGGELRLGRQAIGWGRGMFFSAADLLAPFSPLVCDRDWRPGIDGARVLQACGPNLSIDLLAVPGDSSEAGLFAGRLQARMGPLDGELLAGRRRRDDLAGACLALALLDAELHGELLTVRAPEPLAAGGAWGEDDLALQGLAGGSYRFALGRGLLLAAELHHAGLGLRDISDLPAALAAGDLETRLHHGDLLILGRRAVAVRVGYGADTTLPLALSWLANPRDGSGIGILSLSWLVSDAFALAFGAYAPHGSRPDGGQLRSEYGGHPASVLVQGTFNR